MSYKHSSVAPIPFGLRISVVRSCRFVLPVTAPSTPCGDGSSRTGDVARRTGKMTILLGAFPVHAAYVLRSSCDGECSSAVLPQCGVRWLAAHSVSGGIERSKQMQSRKGSAQPENRAEMGVT